jgi:signal transduction histidine kinase
MDLGFEVEIKGLFLPMQSTEQFSHESRTGIDARMVAATRFLLAFCALVIIFIDPTEPSRLVYETYSLMVIYSIYSLYVLLSVQYGRALPTIIRRHSWWIDTSSYIVLISLSSGTNSIFFFFFFFAVLNAAFSRGFNTGLAVTIVSTAGFLSVAILTDSGDLGFDLGRYLLRPMSLLVLGFMMSKWGDYDNRSRRRLALLRNIGNVSNPRFGIDRTINVNIELIRSFYDADAGLFITRDPETDSFSVHHSLGPHSSEFPNSIRANSVLATKLLSPPENIAGIFTYSSFLTGGEQSFTFDCRKKEVTADQHVLAPLAEILDARSMLTCPIYYRNQSIGRFYVYSSKSYVFDRSDISFSLQAIDHFIPIVENIRLVDQMASDAAEQERKKIARDIHDSIIQPYIGLQIGIDSLSQFLERRGEDDLNDSQLSSRVERLKLIAHQGIEDLRNYVHGLSTGRGGRSSLHESLDRFAEKFSAGTGIDVEVRFEPSVSVGDRLAAEVFQIVTEAVSNVRRHTHSPMAIVDLSSSDNQLLIDITNRSDGRALNFVPRSIALRSESLGGSTRISCKIGATTVHVRIPM